MQKLIRGLQHYQAKIFGSQRDLFERLAQGQSPEVLFITCKDIIICGHSHCGAMKGLLEPPAGRDFPALNQWLCHAESTRRIVQNKYIGHEAGFMLNVTIQENVLAQMENLRTHPVVASGLSQGALKLHGWVYKIETGEVFGYDPESSQFQVLTEQRATLSLPERKFVALEI